MKTSIRQKIVHFIENFMRNVRFETRMLILKCFPFSFYVAKVVSLCLQKATSNLNLSEMLEMEMSHQI